MLKLISMPFVCHCGDFWSDSMFNKRAAVSPVDMSRLVELLMQLKTGKGPR